MYITMIIAYMTSRTEGLGRKSIEVVLSAGMLPGPIKIESLRDVTSIAFQAYRTTPSKLTTTLVVLDPKNLFDSLECFLIDIH